MRTFPIMTSSGALSSHPSACPTKPSWLTAPASSCGEKSGRRPAGAAGAW
jgi:hypothetical protein